MFVGEGSVHGEVAANKESHSWDGVGAALEKDMLGVIIPTAVGACGVIGGGGAVAEGVVALEGVAGDYLECGALEAA
jgi:hypothetical protein